MTLIYILAILIYLLAIGTLAIVFMLTEKIKFSQAVQAATVCITMIAFLFLLICVDWAELIPVITFVNV